MSAVVHDHESITLQRGTPSSTRQYSPEYPKWVLAEQVLKAPHHSQLTALADSVKMLSDWIVHQPCSEEAWNTRLPNEEARPAPPRSRPPPPPPVHSDAYLAWQTAPRTVRMALRHAPATVARLATLLRGA